MRRSRVLGLSHGLELRAGPPPRSHLDYHRLNRCAHSSRGCSVDTPKLFVPNGAAISAACHLRASKRRRVGDRVKAPTRQLGTAESFVIPSGPANRVRSFAKSLGVAVKQSRAQRDFGDFPSWCQRLARRESRARRYCSIIAVGGLTNRVEMKREAAQSRRELHTPS